MTDQPNVAPEDDIPDVAPGQPGAPSEADWLNSPAANRPVVDGVAEVTQDPKVDFSIDDPELVEGS